MTKENLNIEHRFISIGGVVRIMTKNNLMVLVPVWVFGSIVGQLSKKDDSGERCDWLVVMRIKGIQVQ